MRVVVTGATGNVGTSVLRSLSRDPAITEILGLARRIPELQVPKTRFVAADVTRDDLVSLFRGAEVVVHLAWRLQPSRDEKALERVNVRGSRRVFAAVADAAVPRLVYASSVGAYAAGPKDRFVDESWPATGIATSVYSRQKAAVEDSLDRLERERPNLRVTRLRPGLIFKRTAGSEVKGLFIGKYWPKWLFRRSLVPVVPDTPGLRFQAVHSFDAGEAYRLAVLSGERGAFNIAADPVLDPDVLADTLHARKLPLSRQLLRQLGAGSYRLHLHPADPGWLDLALNVPLMDSSRARRELGWHPKRSSREALLELFEGLRHGAGLPTAPLSPQAAG